jgi:hypothetical protein
VTEPRPTAAVGARAALGPATVVVVLLWALGGVLGLIWQWWSPAGPAAYVIAPGQLQPDETEAFVAGDGRYALIVLAVGVLAGLLLWFAGICRGVAAVFVLAVGGLGGAAATAVTGHLARAAGRHYACGDGTARCIDHLRLSLHAHGLLLVEAAAAVLVYGLCVSFAKADDLGRPDPLREWALRSGRGGRGGSVGADVELQHAGRHRDGAGGAQQGDLPAQ